MAVEDWDTLLLQYISSEYINLWSLLLSFTLTPPRADVTRVFMTLTPLILRSGPLSSGSDEVCTWHFLQMLNRWADIYMTLVFTFCLYMFTLRPSYFSSLGYGPRLELVRTDFGTAWGYDVHLWRGVNYWRGHWESLHQAGLATLTS